MKEEKDLSGEKKVAEALDGHHFLGLAIESAAETSDSAVDKTSMPIVKGKALIGKYITRTSTLLCV